MTREEAIEWLVSRKEHYELDDDCQELALALDMAIKALEQEPCEDAVNREAVLEQTYNWSKDEFLRVTNPFDYLRKRINSLPSVTPTCSEKPNNCEDAIGRQAVEEIINDIRDCISVDGYWAILERLKKLPSVTPKQRMGRWIEESRINYNGYHVYCFCGNCKDYYTMDWKEMKYCPNCGAKMTEVVYANNTPPKGCCVRKFEPQESEE